MEKIAFHPQIDHETASEVDYEENQYTQWLLTEVCLGENYRII